MAEKESTFKKGPERLEAGLQTITLIEVAERLAEIQESLAEMKPRGILPVFEETVTDAIKELTGGYAWFSFDIYVEEGSDDVLVMVNHMNVGSARRVGAKGRYAMSAASPIFKNIYVACDSGKTARIRVEGVF